MDIKNLMFHLEYNTKYQIAKRMYPEINEFMRGDKYSLNYITCCATNDYYKKCLDEYYKNCMQVELRYQLLLSEITKLIDKIRIGANPLEIMHIFAYLYYNGYLSIDNNFTFVEPDNELFFKKGMSVFTGKAVCRHICTLLSDILSRYKFQNYGIITDRMTYKSQKVILSPSYFELTEQNEEEKLFSIAYKEKMEARNTFSTGNHFELLTKSKRFGWLLLDPSEIISYKISKKQNEYNTIKYLRFWSLYTTGVLNLDECVYVYNLFKDKYLHILDSNEFMNFEENCYNDCEKFKGKIKQFHNKNYKHIEELANALPKKGLN